MTPKLLTITQVAERLNVSVKTAYHWSSHGRLPGKVSLGQRVRFSEDAIEAVARDGLPRVGGGK